MAFTPEISLPSLKNFYTNGKKKLWTQYGFIDAFNLSAAWYDNDELGIDQGPIVIMIENYRNQNVCRLFMQNPEIQNGLQAGRLCPAALYAADRAGATGSKHPHFDLGGHFKPDLSGGILDQPDLLVYLADRGSDRYECRRKLDRCRPSGHSNRALQ